MSKTMALGLVIAAALAVVMTLTVNTALSSPPTNETTTTVSNLTSATPIYEQHNGSRVIDVTNGSAKLEASYSGNGFAKSIYTVTDQGSLLYTLQSSGAVNGTRQGYITSLDGEMVTYTLKGGGQADKEGNTSFQGTIHFGSIPTGNLAFLSNMKGTYKEEASNKGQITFQV